MMQKNQFVAPVGWNTWDTSSMLSFVHMPEGFHLALGILDRSKNIPVRDLFFVSRQDESPVNIRVEPRTWDGSYIETQVSYAHSALKICSTVRDDELVIQITPMKQGLTPPIVFAQIGFLWGRDGILEKNGGYLTGKTQNRAFRIYTDGEPADYVYTLTGAPCIALELSKTTVISTRACTAQQAAEWLETARQEMQRQDEDRYGSLTEAMQAMRTCMAWSTIYEPEEDCVCTPVSRHFNVEYGGYVLFPWDGFLTAIMISIENPALAKQNTQVLVDGMLRQGFLPNYHSAGKAVQADRSNPPVGAMCCLDIYRRSPELEYLKAVFYPLLRWNQWFAENRMTADGYLSWGSMPPVKQFGKLYETMGVHTTEGATYESGMDLCSIYADIPFCEETSTMYLADMALMGIYVADCRALIEMADILHEDASELVHRLNKVEDAIRSMWSDEMGVYANVRLDTGEFSKSVGPTAFYALFADNIPNEHIKRMIEEWLHPEQKLGGTYPLPTVARDDKGYHPEETLFRGRIWPPVCYLTYCALKRAGQETEAFALADKLLAMFLNEWREHRHVHENHHADTGSGEVPASCAFYGWGALYAYMAWDAHTFANTLGHTNGAC